MYAVLFKAGVTNRVKPTNWIAACAGLVQGIGFRGFRLSGLGFRVQGLGFRSFRV